MSTAITQRAELVDPTSNVVGDAAVPITRSAVVVAKVVGFPPLGFVVIGLRPVLS